MLHTWMSLKIAGLCHAIFFQHHGGERAGRAGAGAEGALGARDASTRALQPASWALRANTPEAL